MQQTSTSHDCTDSIIMISTHNNSSRRSAEDDKDAPIDHRLPSPEEQCLILASKYEHHDINIFISIFINIFLFFINCPQISRTAYTSRHKWKAFRSSIGSTKVTTACTNWIACNRRCNWQQQYGLGKETFTLEEAKRQ